MVLFFLLCIACMDGQCWLHHLMLVKIEVDAICSALTCEICYSDCESEEVQIEFAY